MEQRHPLSARKEPLRKELTQCQYCYKSRHDVKLSLCAACNIDCYCSKECQRKAWPVHKAKCKLNQRRQNDPRKDSFDLLRAFTSKHRPILVETAMSALELWKDPSRCQQDVFHVLLRRRTDSTRPETAYFAYAASSRPLSEFPQADEMREQLRVLNEEQKRMGKLGMMFTVLSCLEDGTTNIAPVGFDREGIDSIGQSPLKIDGMLKRMNEGIVL